MTITDEVALLRETYYLKHHYIPDPRGDREEWRIHRKMYDEMFYIFYKKAGNISNIDACPWMWLDWYSASKEARQQWFKEMKHCLCIEDFVKAKEMLERQPVPTFEFSNPIGWDFKEEWSHEMNYIQEITYPVPEPVNPRSLGICAATTSTFAIPKIGQAYVGPQQKQGNNPMRYDYNSTTIAPVASVVQADPDKEKRRYLNDRLHSIRYKKSDDLRKTFGLVDDPEPKTPKEMAQRIADGKFTIRGIENNDDFESGDRYFDSEYAIRWRDPSLKEDREGYQAAVAELNAKQTELALQDIVQVKSIDEAFDTLKALEDWQPTGKAN